MKRPTRRQILLGGAGLGALSIGVGGHAVLATPADFFGAMMRAEMPGVNIPDSAIKDFVDQALKNRQSDFGPKLKILSAAARVGGYETLRATMGENFSFLKFRRDLLTDFLLGSDFFDHEDPVAHYVGQPQNAVKFYTIEGYCRNRFASLGPPQ